MKSIIQSITLFAVICMTPWLTVGAQKKSTVMEKEISYSVDGVNYKSMIAYDASKKEKLPAILVIPEWWGNNEYSRSRAKQLAELGYFAMAVDMYGEGKLGENPKEAQDLATPFYKDPQLGKNRILAAIKNLNEYPQADVKRIAAIGYCFGGSMVLNAAKLGVDFKAVVSFHGGLAGVQATPGTTKAKILVCHGGADKFISEEDLKNFKSNLDNTKTSYEFIVYEGATHAFTNPAATANGKKFSMPIEYNAAADKKSWDDMKTFLKKTL